MVVSEVEGKTAPMLSVSSGSGDQEIPRAVNQTVNHTKIVHDENSPIQAFRSSTQNLGFQPGTSSPTMSAFPLH